MKIKKFLSFILIFAIVFSTTQFAIVANGYNYLGEIKEGTTTIYREDIKSSEHCLNFSLYKFSAPYDGYYLFEHGGPEGYIWGYLEHKSGDFVFDLIQTESEDNATQQIYYLDKGEYDFNVELASFEGTLDIYTEYLGESVTDITFDYELIEDCDFHEWKDENTYCFKMYADATIHFPFNKEFVLKNGKLSGTLTSKFVEGENEIIIDFMDQQILSSVTVYPVSHYVTDAQLSNAEKYTENVYVYYNGEYHINKYPYGETVTVTFSDGSTACSAYSYINSLVVFPNGHDYRAYVRYDVGAVGRNTLQIWIENTLIREYKLNSTKALFKNNVDLFVQECMCHMQDFVDTLVYSIENHEYMDAFYSFLLLSNIWYETGLFVRFYL